MVFFLLQNFFKITIGLIIINITLIISSIVCIKRVSLIPIPQNHIKIIISHSKVIIGKLLISLLLLVSISVRYSLGVYDKFQYNNFTEMIMIILNDTQKSIYI